MSDPAPHGVLNGRPLLRVESAALVIEISQEFSINPLGREV